MSWVTVGVFYEQISGLRALLRSLDNFKSTV